MDTSVLIDHLRGNTFSRSGTGSDWGAVLAARGAGPEPPVGVQLQRRRWLPIAIGACNLAA
jgi:hypothetical protein